MALFTVDANGQWWQVGVDLSTGAAEIAITAVAAPGIAPGSILVSALINNALLEIGGLDLGGSLSPDEQNFALQKLWDLVDRWNAMRVMSYSLEFPAFTLIPNH